MAVRDPDGYVRIVGRKATDLIKSGGYKIGAGEIENALLEHPGVREAAVTGEPDADLGRADRGVDRPRGPRNAARRRGAGGPRRGPASPRTSGRASCVTCDELPRNDMGKIMKRALHA